MGSKEGLYFGLVSGFGDVLMELAKRNVSFGPVLGLICREYEETVERLFVSCGFSITKNTWEIVSTWCKLLAMYAFSVWNILELKYMGFAKKKARVFYAICLVAL